MTTSFREVCKNHLSPGGFIRVQAELYFLTPRLQALYAEGLVEPDEVYLIGWHGAPGELHLDREELVAYERDPSIVRANLLARASR